MTTLIAVAFPYATTARVAAEEVAHLPADLAPDVIAVAAISLDGRADFRMRTNHGADPRDGRSLVWFLMFSALIFGTASQTASGRALPTLVRRVADVGMDESFQRVIRNELQPGTSALFLLLDRPARPEWMDALRRFAGNVHITSLGVHGEMQPACARYATQDDLESLPVLGALGARSESAVGPA